MHYVIDGGAAQGGEQFGRACTSWFGGEPAPDRRTFGSVGENKRQDAGRLEVVARGDAMRRHDPGPNVDFDVSAFLADRLNERVGAQRHIETTGNVVDVIGIEPNQILSGLNDCLERRRLRVDFASDQNVHPIGQRCREPRRDLDVVDRFGRVEINVLRTRLVARRQSGTKVQPRPWREALCERYRQPCAANRAVPYPQVIEIRCEANRSGLRETQSSSDRNHLPKNHLRIVATRR